jgi:hypothetical protein
MKIKLSEIAKKIIKENRSTPLMLNGKEVDQNSIEIGGVDRRDYPDFSDAYISAASYIDGTPLSDKEIEELDAQNNELVHEKIQDDQLYMQEGESSKHAEPSQQQQQNRFEWEDDPYHSRRFEKSDVSWREYDMDMNPQNYRVKEGEEEKMRFPGDAYDREEKAEKAERGEKGNYSGYSNKPKMAGITFFNVPSGKESIASQNGLTQFKSGKWGFKHRVDPQVVSTASDREKSVVGAAERIFGKGRYWEPRN